MSEPHSVPKPIATGSTHRLGDNTWFGVVDGCNHTIGPDTFEHVHTAMGDHINTCPDLAVNR